MSVILTDKIQPRTTGIALTVVGDTNVSGALTCTNFTASGDVSIGGTLTYEDVTNIDSVGLITARTGVRVTAGGVVVTAGVSTFTDDVKVNSTLTATEGINVTAGVTTIAGDLLIADQIIHSGDSNTSIRFPAADQVKITTAGGSRLHITDNGKIGVGGDPTGYPGKFMVIGAAGGASGILCDREIISRVASGIANTERGFQQIIDGVEKLACFADNSGNFNLNNNNGKNRITVTEAGKVGLGTVNPQLNLHVHTESSNASFGHYTNTTTGVSGSDGVSIGLDSDENAVIYNYESTAIRFATGGSERARITSGGTVGINETSPDSNFKLHVDGMGKFTNNVAMNDGKMMYWGDSDTSFILGYDAAAGGYLAFGSNNERMRLLNTGHLGIGITNPSQRLVVQAGSDNSDVAVLTGGDATRGLKISTAASGNNDALVILDAQNADNGCFAFKTHGDERLRIHSDGKLSLGTANAASSKFNISHGNELALYTSGPYNYQAKFESTDAEAAIVIEDSNSTDNANRIGVITNDMNFITNDSEKLRITSTGRIQYYTSAGSFASFRESFKSGAVSNGGTFTAQTHNCHACGTVTITSNLDGSSNNKRCVQFPISLNSTSNANLGSSLFSIDGSSGQNFSVAGASKGVTVTNDSGNTVHITVTFDITGSV